jgi:hypothetical protein
LTLIILANIHKAAKHPWGHTFCNNLSTIKQKYVYSATSFKYILDKCTKADQVRAMKDAPGLNGEANAVSKYRSILQNAAAADLLLGKYNSNTSNIYVRLLIPV